VAGVTTERQRRGALAEAEVAAHLAELGWRVLARNVKVGRDEIDLVAVDPGPPQTLVLVEVRSLRTAAFGVPEERVDRAKVARLYRALAALIRSGGLTALGVGRLPARIDLVVADRRPGHHELRHLRALEPA
jgi:putative endonuclease